MPQKEKGNLAGQVMHGATTFGTPASFSMYAHAMNFSLPNIMPYKMRIYWINSIRK